MVCGILLGYLGSYLFVDTVGGWRIMYGASAVPALILLAGMVRLLSQLGPQASLPPEASIVSWPRSTFSIPPLHPPPPDLGHLVGPPRKETGLEEK